MTMPDRIQLEGALQITVEDVRRELSGKTLACWCPLPKPGEVDVCHGAVLLEIASQHESNDTAGAREK